MEPILRPDPNLFEPWMTWVFLLVFALLAWVRVVYARRYRLLWRTILRLQILRQVMREELLFSHRASLVLFTNFILSAGLLIYAAVRHYDLLEGGMNGFIFFLVLSLVLLGAYLLKFLSMSILGWLYRDEGLLREYRFEVFSVNKALGLILLPLALVVVTSNVGKLQILFTIALIIWVLFFLFRLVQGLVMSFAYRVSRVYIILYLCTLEILPLLLLLSFFDKEFF